MAAFNDTLAYISNLRHVSNLLVTCLNNVEASEAFTKDKQSQESLKGARQCIEKAMAATKNELDRFPVASLLRDNNTRKEDSNG